MERPGLEDHPATGLQAANAHLPSRATWQRQDGPQTPATLAPILVGEMPGRQTGDARQPGQAHCRHRWRGVTHALPTTPPGPTPGLAPKAATGPAGVDTKATRGGTTPARDTGSVRPSSPSAHQAR